MQMFIAGEYTDTASGETTTIYNPATGEVVDTVPKGTADDVKRAVAAAEEAAVEWGKFAPSKRGECLAEAARLVLENEKELTELLTKEQGKAHRESVLEIRRFAHTLEHYAGMAKTLRGGYVKLADGRYGLIMHKPMGVVGSIVPWNFPVSLMGNKVGPALLGRQRHGHQARQHHAADRHPVRRAGAAGRASQGHHQHGHRAGRRRGARRSSATRSSARWASPAPPTPASGSWKWPPRRSSGSPWSWAAATP